MAHPEAKLAALPTEKVARYEELSAEILAVVDGEANLTARMSSVACLLHHAFPQFYWTGFYLVDPDKPTELVVGPYQGTMGCLRIPIGRGVCGTAAETRETQIVADVDAFAGHIACDANSKSEIVVPVIAQDGTLVAVLDIDSDQTNAFDDTDKAALEALIARVFA